MADSLRHALRKAIDDVVDLAEEGQSDYGPGINYGERRQAADDRLELLMEQVPDVDIYEAIDVEP